MVCEWWGRCGCVDGGTVSAGTLTRLMARYDLRRGCRPRASSHYWGAGCIVGAKSSWTAGGLVPTIRCVARVSVAKEPPRRVSCTRHVVACALDAVARDARRVGGKGDAGRYEVWNRARRWAATRVGSGRRPWSLSRSKGESKVLLIGPSKAERLHVDHKAEGGSPADPARSGDAKRRGPLPRRDCVGGVLPPTTTAACWWKECWEWGDSHKRPNGAMNGERRRDR